MFHSWLWFIEILRQAQICSLIEGHPMKKIVSAIDTLYEAYPDSREARLYMGKWF